MVPPIWFFFGCRRIHFLFLAHVHFWDIYASNFLGCKLDEIKTSSSLFKKNSFNKNLQVLRWKSWCFAQRVFTVVSTRGLSPMVWSFRHPKILKDPLFTRLFVRWFQIPNQIQRIIPQKNGVLFFFLDWVAPLKQWISMNSLHFWFFSKRWIAGVLLSEMCSISSPCH